MMLRLRPRPPPWRVENPVSKTRSRNSVGMPGPSSSTVSSTVRGRVADGCGASSHRYCADSSPGVSPSMVHRKLSPPPRCVVMRMRPPVGGRRPRCAPGSPESSISSLRRAAARRGREDTRSAAPLPALRWPRGGCPSWRTASERSATGVSGTGVSFARTAVAGAGLACAAVRASPPMRSTRLAEADVIDRISAAKWPCCGPELPARRSSPRTVPAPSPGCAHHGQSLPKAKASPPCSRSDGAFRCAEAEEAEALRAGPVLRRATVGFAFHGGPPSLVGSRGALEVVAAPVAGSRLSP